MKSKNMVVVERMTNLGVWEFFRFADEETDDVICKVALRHDESTDEIEYGVWRRGDAEPSAVGKLDVDAEDEWGDEVRERTLDAIAGIYRQGLPEVANGLVFKIGEDEGDEVDDRNGHEAGDDEDDADDDSDEEDDDGDDGKEEDVT